MPLWEDLAQAVSWKGVGGRDLCRAFWPLELQVRGRLRAGGLGHTGLLLGSQDGACTSHASIISVGTRSSPRPRRPDWEMGRGGPLPQAVPLTSQDSPPSCSSF